MKHKSKIFDLGRSTYFHHRHGVFFHKKRSRVLTLYIGFIIFVAIGGFIATHYAIPAAKRISALQKEHTVKVNSTVFAASENKKAPVDNRKENEALKELIEEKLATYPKNQNWSVFLYDLTEHDTVNIDSDKVFASASLYKLFLLEALEARLPFDKWAYTWLPDGTNVQDCVQHMLEASDSACGEGIGGYLGWDFINGLNHRNGFKHTSVAGIEGRQTTAADTGEFLIRLKKGQILSDKARRYVFDVLYQQISTQGLAAGCSNCRTADKVGELTGILNNAGIVTHGGRSYVLVVLSKGGSLKQMAEITRTIESQ